jgi:hypothetical protein
MGLALHESGAFHPLEHLGDRRRLDRERLGELGLRLAVALPQLHQQCFLAWMQSDLAEELRGSYSMSARGTHQCDVDLGLAVLSGGCHPHKTTQMVRLRQADHAKPDK